jgi:hypothetical protein
VLKMKNDMRALATEQFAAAATQHRALQVSLCAHCIVPLCALSSIEHRSVCVRASPEPVQQPDYKVFASRQSDSSRACASLDKRAM